MNRTWELTDIEFVALWEAGNRDGRLPDPLMFTCRTPDPHEYYRQKCDAWERLRGSGARWFEPVMEAIARPDIRIVAEGYDGADPLQANVPARLLGVRRGDRGYVVSEMSGETWSHSGGFVIAECDAVGLAGTVVDTLPVVGPGRLSEVVLSTRQAGESLDYSYGRSSVLDSYDEPESTRSESFLTQPASCIGTIDVVQGTSRFGPRGITRYTMEWRDLIGDGRYMIDDAHPSVAVAVDSHGLVSMINYRVGGVIRAIKDEREHVPRKSLI
jgi:hypothetical protein